MEPWEPARPSGPGCAGLSCHANARSIGAVRLPSQDKSLGVSFNKGFKAAHKTFDAERAYNVVKAVAKLGPKMMEMHEHWTIWSPELMICGLSEEITHPCAIKAYKELGWWEKRRACEPVTYPSN